MKKKDKQSKQYRIFKNLRTLGLTYQKISIASMTTMSLPLESVCSTTTSVSAQRRKNNGVLPQHYVEDDHEAIIPKDLFMQVLEELVRRRNVHRSPSGKKRVYSGNNCFSQMVVCGECGELYRRVHWNNHGCKSIVWRCISRLELHQPNRQGRTPAESHSQGVQSNTQRQGRLHPTDAGEHRKSDNSRRHDEPGRYPGTARRAAEGTHPKAYPTDSPWNSSPASQSISRHKKTPRHRI